MNPTKSRRPRRIRIQFAERLDLLFFPCLVVLGIIFLLLVFAPPSKHAKIKKQLGKLIHVPFKFEFGGSQVIFHEVEEDYSAHDKVREKQQIEAFRELDADAPGAS